MPHKKVLFIFLYCISSYCFGSSNQAIQTILDTYRIQYHLPAISLSIQFPNRNKINNYVTGKNITSETLFQMGSITKTFTATIIYQLMEENKLNLNDTLDKWLPQYPRWKRVTINNLLHHTSGTYNYTSGKSFDRLLRKNPHKYWSLNELANMSYAHPDLYAPGKKYNYTNTDYILLGMIIEKATQESVKKVFNDYFEKYQLKNTYYLVSENKMGHSYNRDGTFPFNQDVSSVNISFTQTAGGIISTPHDIVKWLHLLFNGKIISDSSLKMMTQIISETDAKPVNINKITLQDKSFTEIGIGAGIGLIYFKNIGFVWMHSGGTPGYESFYVYDPRCKIYMALAYNVKPNQQLIFMKIAEDILGSFSCRK